MIKSSKKGDFFEGKISIIIVDRYLVVLQSPSRQEVDK